MKYLKRNIISFFAESIVCFAPYTVVSDEFKTCHFCWTWKEALKWLSCYDGFSNTRVLNFNGEFIAGK